MLNFLALKISRKNEMIISFKYPKNPYLNQATQKNTCENFPTQKYPEIKNFKPQRILRSSLSLEKWLLLQSQRDITSNPINLFERVSTNQHVSSFSKRLRS